ncbi:MAG: hypothetical protein A3F74_24215 [Betaproteobacteria bacterium RIFCSPLOWO2_12_FULL_62_58]|nr:MAG: hypothetical protein A3F74_24215 [Betaproteobacteria bacterium RIFCSPLOWO2_12_FULL_62_58]
MSNNGKRLIEVAFPLEQTSLDSVHEKNVRHGHISTLHIWPARRPLAASRAVLIATLLPDPGDKKKRDEILKRLAGTVEKSLKKKKLPSGKIEEIETKETVGGILHWGRESGPDLEWFRQEIRKAYGGRAPKVLDPFAGGGAIPLEAMRLGCEVTAVDINPVAWFILKCTLEYPQKLAGQKRRLPDFALRDRDFMTGYFKALGLKPKDIRIQLDMLARKAESGEKQKEMFEQHAISQGQFDADLAWHVRAWGHWVLKQARKELAQYYPTYAEFCTLKPYARVPLARADEEQLKLVPTNDDGDSQIELLNAGYDQTYLDNPANPRWVAKPTVAYLWARTVKCKACRAIVPLLKTRWLAKKDNKRVLLTLEPNADRTGVVFGIDQDVKVQGGNPAQRREHDKRISAGTMSRSGVTCAIPGCGTTMTMADLRLEGRGGRLKTVMTAVVVAFLQNKEYRLPTVHEIKSAEITESDLERIFIEIPFGLPEEPTPKAGLGAARAFSVDLYGFDQWKKLFTLRELLFLGVLTRSIRETKPAIRTLFSEEWGEAIHAMLAIALDRTANYLSTICIWESQAAEVKQTFLRYALPITWDFAEGNPLAPNDRFFFGALSNVAQVIERLDTSAFRHTESPKILNQSAVMTAGEHDIIVTDPPYYDAIPYSDLMDFFYVWLRRVLVGLNSEFDSAFAKPLAPKWNHETQDGELIDDASRFGGDVIASKKNYEDGMAHSFTTCHAELVPTGRLVVVFANKQPDAWETLVSAIIRAGFVVDGSWPIATEMRGGVRNFGRASLASSIWLICRKRDPIKRAGWDTDVLKEMEVNIKQRLRDFWDAGIRGPDFVWAATGPALEAYSQYPAVKKATESGALMTVSEFLRHVRRMVVDFVVGRVLSGGEGATETRDISLDDITTYYLLHRNDFGLKDAPAGACILYAVSCGLSERLLADQYEILSRGKGAAADEESGDEADDVTDEDASDESSGSGGQFKLKAWNQRKHRNLGVEPANGKPVPLIDQVHKLMQLWKAGDENKVNDYLEQRGLRRSDIFHQLVQSLIEKSRAEGQAEECSILEKLSNHLRKIGATAQGALTLGA